MLTHKSNGAVIPHSGHTMSQLEAPANGMYAFVGGSGWIGVQCACGLFVSARTLAGVQAALSDHQEPLFCAVAATTARAENEDVIDE